MSNEHATRPRCCASLTCVRSRTCWPAQAGATARRCSRRSSRRIDVAQRSRAARWGSGSRRSVTPGMPRPEVNVWLALPGDAGFTADFVWQRYGLVVKTDGMRYHATRAGFGRDRRRDQALMLTARRVVRFTWRQVFQEADQAAATVHALLDQHLRRRLRSVVAPAARPATPEDQWPAAKHQRRCRAQSPARAGQRDSESALRRAATRRRDR
jgi:hypothetical protein